MLIYRLQKLLTFAFLIVVFLILFPGPDSSNILAFDDASEIHHTYLNQENFLDIKSFQFHKLKEDAWFESPGGWRMNGGSMGLNLLYSHLELFLPHVLSDETTVFFRAWQEEFYEIKPFRYLVEVEWRAIDLVAFSLLGMPEYDKRKADQGASITLGKRPWNFIRFQQLFQDLFYNQKNFYDNSYYSSHPIEKEIEGSFNWRNWRVRFNHLRDKPFEQVFPKQDITLTYNGTDNRAVFDYHIGYQRLSGISWRSFKIHKRRETTRSTETASPDSRYQQLIYDSTDFYWLHPLSTNLHGTIGLREDYFRNYFRQLDLAYESYDFHLWTFQIYGVLRHQTELDRFWEYGFYLGDTEKVTNYLKTEREDKRRRKTEAKFRASWEFQDYGNQSAFLLTTTWNIDDFFNNFWDGGNISYQRTF